MKTSLQEPPVIVVHEGLVPEHPTPCPEEPAIGAVAAPAWFVPPATSFVPSLPAKLVPPPTSFVPPLPAKLVPPSTSFVPPLPAKLVCPLLPALPPFTGSSLVDAHEDSVALISKA